jgi:hypothetical protein
LMGHGRLLYGSYNPPRTQTRKNFYWNPSPQLLRATNRL